MARCRNHGGVCNSVVDARRRNNIHDIAFRRQPTNSPRKIKNYTTKPKNHRCIKNEIKRLYVILYSGILFWDICLIYNTE